MATKIKFTLMAKIYSKIIGTGKYIPNVVVKNENFLNNEFFEEYGKRLERPNEDVIQKFYEITGIKERRYTEDDVMNSDIGFLAAEKALADSGIDPETLDYIIVGHNYGDVRNGHHFDMVPALASRIKHNLKIKNPWCVAYDVPFGCPGWVQGMIQADYFIKSGDAKRILVIGTDTLGKITDPNDRDAMIFADGAGATVLEAVESDEPIGIISHLTRSDTLNEAYYIYNDVSLNPDFKGDNFMVKMLGRKVYEYALTNVPDLAKRAIDKAGLDISDIKKILIHQANEKMDAAIVKRLFRLYKIKDYPENVMPMTIGWLGNSSVATIPTMIDLILNKEMENQEINEGDYVVFTSVGAGMHINAIVYKF